MATAKEKYNICLDVGGTKVLGAIFNEQDKIIYRLKKRSKSAGSASTDVEKVIVDVVEEMIKESGIDRAKLNAVASCAPGVIDQEKGIVLFTPNLPWRDYDMAGSMSKKFGVPFFVGNDVNLGVLGEYHFGAAQGYKNIVGFFVGTGMGGGLILDGKLFTGHKFKAAEYGHMILDPEGPLCGCGQRGCIEAYASATGVARTAKEIVTATTQPTLLRNVADIDHITSKDVFDAAEKGDLVAKEIFDYTGHLLGQKLADYVHFSSPEAIILFGGLTKAGHWIMDPIREAFEANLMPIWKGKIPVSISVLKDSDAAILGASSLAW